MYKYTMRNTGYSSQRFGNCEICGQHVSEMHHQTELKQVTRNGNERLITTGCEDYYGHKECLESKQRN